MRKTYTQLALLFLSIFLTILLMLFVASVIPATATEPEQAYTINIQQCENVEVDCLKAVIYGNPDIPEGEYELVYSEEEGVFSFKPKQGNPNPQTN